MIHYTIYILTTMDARSKRKLLKEPKIWSQRALASSSKRTSSSIIIEDMYWIISNDMWIVTVCFKIMYVSHSK